MRAKTPEVAFRIGKFHLDLTTTNQETTEGFDPIENYLVLKNETGLSPDFFVHVTLWWDVWLYTGESTLIYSGETRDKEALTIPNSISRVEKRLVSLVQLWGWSVLVSALPKHFWCGNVDVNFVWVLISRPDSGKLLTLGINVEVRRENPGKWSGEDFQRQSLL